MLTSQILLAGLIILISHGLEAVTGFGCTVIALPFITAIFGIKEGVMIVTILALLLALYIVFTNLKYIVIKEYFKILFFMCLGLPIGIYLSSHMKTDVLQTILALFIIFVSILQLTKIYRTLHSDNKPIKEQVHLYHYIILFAAGIVHGLFSSGGPLAILYTAKALPEKKQFRATLCLLWATLNTIIIITYFVKGTLTKSVGITTAEMLPFLVIGIIIGEKIHNKVSEVTFKIVIFSSLLVTGIFMIL